LSIRLDLHHWIVAARTTNCNDWMTGAPCASPFKPTSSVASPSAPSESMFSATSESDAEYLALAALPLLFGLHQLDEVFVWSGMQGHASPETGRTATWLYLLFAFVLLRTYVPFAVRRIEPSGRRRIAMDAFLVIGVGVSITLLIALRRGPVRAQLALNHLSYTSGHHVGWPIVGAYVVAT
jgi:hypothetical protein